MSRLAGLAKAVSDYMRRRISSGGSTAATKSRDLLRHPDPRSGSPPVQRGAVDAFPDRRSGAPPAPQSPPRIPPYDPRRSSGAAEPPSLPPPLTGNAPTGDDDFDDVQLLGRDASYHEDDLQALPAKMRQVSSSNVFAYGFEQESERSGILYVTFLDWTPAVFGGSGDRSGPGPTYAYYDIPVAKYKQFQAMAEISAGGAVWDYVRVRGSAHDHQHTYRLIQTSGDYVPRKATPKGFRRRTVANPGIGRRGGHNRKQLPELLLGDKKARNEQRRTMLGRGQLNRGSPNRGEPNRGTPRR